MATGGPEDYLVRAQALDGTVRAVAVRSTAVGARLLQAHDPSPTAGAAVVRTATAALLLGGTLKGREQIGLQIKGDGPLGMVYAVADARGNVRVSVDHPRADLPPRADGRFDVGGLVGQGNLSVIKSLGLKEPYQGMVELVTGEIATDLAHYFTLSEQKPTAVGLGELLGPDGVRAAGGFLIQAFPGADEDLLAQVEARLGALGPLSRMFELGATPEELLERLFRDLHVLDRYPVRFECNCSRARYEEILITLGSAELRHLAEEDPVTELVCHFCNTRYFFSHEDMRALAEAAAG